MLDVKFTDLGIEIRVRDEIDAGLREADVDCAYPPGDPRRYGEEKPRDSSDINTGTEV